MGKRGKFLILIVGHNFIFDVLLDRTSTFAHCLALSLCGATKMCFDFSLRKKVMRNHK